MFVAGLCGLRCWVLGPPWFVAWLEFVSLRGSDTNDGTLVATTGAPPPLVLEGSGQSRAAHTCPQAEASQHQRQHRKQRDERTSQYQKATEDTCSSLHTHWLIYLDQRQPRDRAKNSCASPCVSLMCVTTGPRCSCYCSRCCSRCCWCRFCQRVPGLFAPQSSSRD